MHTVLPVPGHPHFARSGRLLQAGLAAALALGTASIAAPARAGDPPPPSECVAADTATTGADTVLTFTNLTTCLWTVPRVATVRYLVVGGGGGAAHNPGNGPGAGGAGGLLAASSVAVTAGSQIPIRAGTGGGTAWPSTGAGITGGDSNLGSLAVAKGGGAGGASTGGVGGSGGGGGNGGAPGAGTGVGAAQQGFAGGSSYAPDERGGGGGGAGGLGGTASMGVIGAPGLGVTSNITGSSVLYAEGGQANSSGCVSLARASKITAISCAGVKTASVSPTIGFGGDSQNSGVPSGGGTDGAVIVRYQTPPTAPGAPTAVAGNATATVTFPASSGLPTPTSYTVQAVEDPTKSCTYTTAPTLRSRIKTADVLSFSCTVSGLTNGTIYTFWVKANKDATYSDWSAGSNPVTPVAPPSVPTTPNAPVGVTAAAGTASVTATWTPVSGATGYTVTAAPGPSTCSTTTETSCVLGAVAGTTYTVTVVARSGARSSAASAPSNPVTPLEPAIPSTPPPTAPITLTTDKGQIALATPGQQIVVIGTGFAAYSTATVIIYSTPIELGTVTTDGTGGFSVPVTVPADLASGQHTFLASGVDPAGGTRVMALPVTVAPSSGGSTGGGGGTGTGTLPIPSGGSITLLDAAGQPATTVIVTQGTYALDTETGTISFVPVAGFVGTATSVTYRITDAIGTVVTGTYTAVVTAPAPPSPPAGKPTVKLPVRIISSTGKHGTAQASCRISSGSIAKCTITVTAVVSKRTVVVGRGAITPKASQSLKRVTVKAALNALGRSLAARPGGARFTFTGVIVQRGRTGSTTARGVSTVLARTIVLPRAVHFSTDSATVGSADIKYLKSVRAKLAGAKVITCVGHADSRGSAKAALKLGARRAKAACAVLTKGRKVVVHTVSKGEKAPTGKNNTEAGRARNRRVDITIHN